MIFGVILPKVEKERIFKKCPGLNAIEIQIPYDKHHKVSPLAKSQQNTLNSVIDEVLIKQYLRSILDVSDLRRSPKDLRSNFTFDYQN